ncbi:Acetylxylan esterase / glucomannan deacetylase [Asticcacaulis sp. MM231]|uniref:SGNH/GDSL hydrolase family protein n=1 Tax=Asticcacaulis sp. MM231 TaxID=3157666 RepID=UPI0032D59C10
MQFIAALLSGIVLAGAAQAETRLEFAPQKNDNYFWQLPVYTGGRTALETYISVDFPYGPYQVHQWPGTYYETTFTGPEVYFALSDNANILSVSVDDVLLGKLSKPGSRIYRVSGLSNAPHRIRIERNTETQNEKGGFHGFDLPNFKPGAVMPPQPPLLPRTRQIEFIGNSYTVGYGNTAGKRQCTKDELWATTDTQQAFGPLTAKHYNADYQINAFSGRGIVRNYDGFIGDTLPALYPYALYDGKTEYHDPLWQPQLIVIALGTNDFSTPVHAGEKWKTEAELIADYEATYVNFVKSLRTKNPDAAVLLISYDPATTPQITTVRDRLKAQGDAKVDFLEITGFTKNACDYHPDTDDDRKISQTLIAYLDAHPAFWQGK